MKKEIEDERKRRSSVIYEIKSFADKLAYKMSEKSAISQLAQMSHTRTKDIGFLRRKKEQLEFRISTEAFSLEAEKDLIRKKAVIEKELNEALASYRLKKKEEYLSNDIESLGKRVAELEEKIKESEKKLDVSYSRLRQLTGDERRRSRPERKPQREQKSVDISLADIAIIKKGKKEDKGEGEEDAVLN